jgi:DNA-binding transcriptional LysR family regulator
VDLLEAMTAYVRTAERGSFSAAARDLGTTQPNVTRAIQQLELRLRVRLFHRTTRRLVLTDEGRDYLERCRDILAAVADADQSVGAGAKTLRGQLRVFAPVSLGRAWIVPRLGEFLGLHPDLTINLVLDDRVRDLVEERLDVGIRVGPFDGGTMRVRKLGDVERLIVATSEFWNRHGRPAAPGDLNRYEWLIFDGTIRVDGVRCVRGEEAAQVAFKGRFSTNSSEAIHEALLCGHGACLAPYWLLAKDLTTGRLEQVLGDWRTEPALPIYAVYPETKAPTEKVRRFIDWMVYTLHSDGMFAVERPSEMRPKALEPA